MDQPVSFVVRRMRACYAKKNGSFVSLVLYNQQDDQSQTDVVIANGTLTVSFMPTSEQDAKEKKTRFLYPDHPQFQQVVAFGKMTGMLPADFNV
jgi:hypothetical protein